MENTNQIIMDNFIYHLFDTVHNPLRVMRFILECKWYIFIYLLYIFAFLLLLYFQ